MSAPTKALTGTLLMQRDWIYEFDLTGSGGWAECEGVTNTQFQPSAAVWTDATDQSGGGLTSEVKTGGTFTGSLTIQESTDSDDPTVHAPVQDFLHSAGEATGAANVVTFRVYEYDFSDPTGVASPRVYAYTGKAGIDYAPPSADVNAKRTAVVTLHPDPSGPLARITHPFPAA